MSNYSALNVIHVQQFIDYLKFELQNRKEIESDVSDELQDLLEARISESKTYTGQEIIDALEDIPDLLENVMDRQLEHVRDITMVLIKKVFTQANEKKTLIKLPISQLEDEQMLNNAHTFCQSLLKEPEQILEKAPKVEGYTPQRNQIKKGPSRKEELERLRMENAQLKADIQKGLDEFPQYKKLKQMIHEREVEIRGLKARL
ncbi:Leucine zipper transcription factor-like protein 1 [Tritrichomonas musculus]|uniref:Leucine zipper transcription factor-like protein 1 n=1 Tax=Tritrichomonas musculus TaxID=1915356 RepID=A0ABR2KKS9_9EUKA